MSQDAAFAARLVNDRYMLVARIGQGGAGSVYLADDLRLPGRQCAVKEIVLPTRIGSAAAETIRAAFHAEAVLLARLDHPALPRVSDHFVDNERSVLVMDFVAGQDLAALLDEARSRDRMLDVRQVLSWSETLCDILSYLHRQRPPVIHRDIKPSNIKLTPDGQIKLVDFGLAATGGEPADGITVTVQGGGSRPYQPLEQYGEGGDADPRADLYALSATLYHLLTGRAPSSARDRFLDPNALRDIADIRPDVPATTVGAIAQGMALHPDKRPASAEDLRRRLISPAVPDTGVRAGQNGNGGANSTVQDVPITLSWTQAIRANGALVGAVMILLLFALAVTFRP